MYNYCCVPNCNSLRRDVKFHVFACTDNIRLKKWLDCVNSDTLRALGVDELQKCYVCHKHFEKRFITSKSRLLGIGYPTLFSDDEISSGIPSLHHEDTEKVTGEHNYVRKRHHDHTYVKGVTIHDFPNPKRYPEQFQIWVAKIGKSLSNLRTEQIYRNKKVCHIHFTEKDWNRNSRLNAVAVPSLHLPEWNHLLEHNYCKILNEESNLPDSFDLILSPEDSCSRSNEQQESSSEPAPQEKDNCSGRNEQQASSSEPAPREKGTKAKNINLMNDESQDLNDAEYPEEDLYDNADLFENIQHSDDYRAHNVKPTVETHEQHLSMDEIDNLFSSYMVTFRKFPSKLQTMLKIDLAKLFARYEMKNATLQCTSDEQQQANDDTPSTTLLEKTKTTEKRKFPTEILTHSKNAMPKSRGSNKNTEGAINKSSSKKHLLLNNKAIIKKRVSDTKDTNNIVLQTNDQYQKPMKVRKLKEDNVDADTSRRVSNCQDLQDTSAILITDRSSKKLTIESDDVSQSGLPTSLAITGQQFESDHTWFIEINPDGSS